MTPDQIIALARVAQANVSHATASRDLDDAITDAIELGLSTREVARFAGLGFATVARRQRLLRAEPGRREGP